MTTKAQQLGIKQEFGGYTFEWGPNKYIVKRNFAGNMVWRRCDTSTSWWRRVDLLDTRDSAFRTKILACVECIMLGS